MERKGRKGGGAQGKGRNKEKRKKKKKTNGKGEHKPEEMRLNECGATNNGHARGWCYSQ